MYGEKLVKLPVGSYEGVFVDGEWNYLAPQLGRIEVCDQVRRICSLMSSKPVHKHKQCLSKDKSTLTNLETLTVNPPHRIEVSSASDASFAL